MFSPVRSYKMTRMSPSVRASNEGLLRPRVARAHGTHRAIHHLFTILLDRRNGQPYDGQRDTKTIFQGSHDCAGPHRDMGTPA